MQDDDPGDAFGDIARLTASVAHVADDPHTRYRSTYLLDGLFHDLVVAAAPVVFVEAGAFEADTSVRVAAALPDCRVVAFEANPHNYAHFTSVRDFASLGVDYRHRALAAEPGEVTFHVIASSSSLKVGRVEGMNSLLRRTGGDYLGDVEYEEVRVTASTLDEEFGALTGPFAMWVDVEGATGLVLAGAQRFLDGCAVIKVEVERQMSWEDQWLDVDVFAEMARHGLVPVARDAQGADQYNVLFCRRATVMEPAVVECLAEHHRTADRDLRVAQSRVRRNPVLRRIARYLSRRR